MEYLIVKLKTWKDHLSWSGWLFSYIFIYYFFQTWDFSDQAIEAQADYRRIDVSYILIDIKFFRFFI